MREREIIVTESQVYSVGYVCVSEWCVNVHDACMCE